jgi:phenylalanyl-tRNA synthetase beta chain
MMGFFDLKGIVEGLMVSLGLSAVYKPAQHPSFHPGRCAQVLIDDQAIGLMGELHPQVRDRIDLPDQPVCALELDLDLMLEARTGTMTVQPVSVHPPVYEDIALIVDEGMTAEQMEKVIRQAGGGLLREARLFDVYRGEQVGEGKKSMAYALTFQSGSKTLKDAEVARVRERIVRKLSRATGAVLRG